jgi:dihydrofolate reductase
MIYAIVCADENWGIGNKGDLLVHIPEDMKFFKKKTNGNIVIMGRKTYDSLPVKPLSNRTNVVITSKVDNIEYNQADNYYLVGMNFAKDYILSTHLFKDYFDVFVIGGGTIYKELLPFCDKAYVTKVLNSYNDVDTYFPNIDNMSEWEIESTSEVKEYNNIKYQFCEYRKRA